MQRNQLPVHFLDELDRLLNEEERNQYLDSFQVKARRCAWSRTSIDLGFESFDLSRHAHLIPEEFSVIEDIRWHAGLYSCQDANAMTPVVELSKWGPFSKILDLCAAPGGKTIQLHDLLTEDGLLVSNEVNQARSKILLQNIERMGLVNQVVSSLDPELLSQIYPNEFDCVVVDAPCSGEGMFRKYPDTIKEYSEEVVKLCAARQQRILNHALHCLKPGGILLYSTCTYNPRENEEIVEAFQRQTDRLEFSRLWPHKTLGEGQTYFILRKKGEWPSTYFSSIQSKSKPEALSELSSLLTPSGLNQLESYGEVVKHGTKVSLRPRFLDQLSSLPKRGIIRSLIPLLDIIKGKRKQEIIPHHALSHLMRSPDRFIQFINLDNDEALKYLKGESLRIDAKLKSGFVAVGSKDLVLGWGKYHENSSQLKNHFPKGLRILKQIDFGKD